MSSVSHELGRTPFARSRRDVALAARRLRPAALPLAVMAVLAAVALAGGGYALGVRSPLGIVAWWTAGLAAAHGVWPRARLPRPAALAVGALVGLAALAALSTLWADSAEAAVEASGRSALYAGMLLLVVLAARRGSAIGWSDGCAAAIALVGLAALASRLLPALGLGDSASQFFDGDVYLSYPLDYWNGLAVFVALGLPLALRTALDGRAAWARVLAIGVLPALCGALYLTSSRGGMLTAAVACAAFVVLADERLRAAAATALALTGGLAVVVVLSARDALLDGPFGTDAVATQGRSAAVLIALVCIATGCAWHVLSGVRLALPRPRRALRRAAVVVAAVLLVGAVVATDPAARFDSFSAPPPNPLAQPAGDLVTGGHLASATGNGRWQFWEAAADAFRAAPLIGHGAGSYESWWAQHGSISYFTRQAHSLYLETAAELGIAGLALLAALVLVAARAARRRLRAVAGSERTAVAALCAVALGYAAAAGVDWMWQLPAVTFVALLALGLLLGRATLPAGELAVAVESLVAPPRNARRLRIAAPACATLAIALLALPWLAQRDVRDSRAAALAGDTAGAVERARAAERLTPWAASPHLQHALALEGGGDLAGARREIARAERRSPSDWRLALVAARIERAAGAAGAARAALARARSLNPRSPLITTTKGSP